MDPSESQSRPLAGPSNPPPAVFPAPPPLPHPKQYLHSTQDLLSVFNLLPAYDKYVRPHVRPIGDSDTAKGKGKERQAAAGDAPVQEREGDDEDAGEKKKKKDSYRHLIKRTPGKHSMKKDNYFQTLMVAPPKQKMQMQLIDAKTLREGFSVSLTGLPSYNKASLEGTDPKEKEAKRLKKERRKAEKEERQRLQQQAQRSGSGASTPMATSTPRAAATPGSSTSHARNISAITPIPKTKPLINSRSSPARPGTPKVSVAQQRMTSTPILPLHQPTAAAATATATAAVRVVSHSVPVAGHSTQVNGVITSADDMRGTKRELEMQHTMTPGQAPGSVNNPHLRPQKKRRIGSSTPQSVPLQQPTPHGS